MTDDPNAQPEIATTADEANADLDDAQLEAASERAKADVDSEMDGPGIAGEATDEGADELGDDGLSDDDLDERDALAGAAAGATAGATATGGLRPESRVRREHGPKAATRTAFAIDPALRIQDRWSAAYVIASVAVFVAILGYAMLFGHGGALTPVPTATPIATEAAPTEVPSGSVAPSGSATGSAAPSQSITPTEPPPTPVR